MAKRRPIDLKTAEKRTHLQGDFRSATGRSTCVVTCPFCGGDTLCYIWSLAGGGKRCGCGAMHYRAGVSYRDIDAPIDVDATGAAEDLIRAYAAVLPALRCGACADGRHPDCSGWCYCTECPR